MCQHDHSQFVISESARFLAGELALRNQKVIFFIGAGVSLGSGLPLGDAVRDKILIQLYPDYPSFERVETFHSFFYPDQPDVTLEMVLQQLGQKLGHAGIDDFLRSLFGKIPEPSLSHDVLASLAEKKYISLILTTNLDNLLEQSLRRKRVNCRLMSGRTEYISIDHDIGKEVIVWKLHGDLGNERSLSVTKEDVLHFPPDKQDTLRWLLQNYHVVFVGYSVRDPDILEVISKVTRENKKYSFFWVDVAPFDRSGENVRSTLGRLNQQGNYIHMASDDFFNELNYLLCLRPPVVIWKADQVKVLRGGVRGEGDPWNRDCPSYARIFGAGPHQEHYSEWEGAVLQLQASLREPLKAKKDLLKGACLRIEIPPIDGKGIHGGKNRKVNLYLVREGRRLKISRLNCVKKGYLETYWPHDDRYHGIFPQFSIGPESVRYFDNLKDIILELEVQSQVCMDASKFLLYFY